MELNNKQKGFTLIEIALVLFIFALAFSMVALNPKAFTSSDTKLEKASKVIFNEICFLRQSAIYEHTLVRVGINVNTLKIQKLITTNNLYQWIPIPNMGNYNLMNVKDGISMKLNHPYIEFGTSGGYQPFSIQINSQNSKKYFVVVGDAQGIIGIKRYESQ